MGAVAEAEKALDAAESLDPSWQPTLFDLARYASDRGDAERGLLLLERAGADPKDGLVVLLERFRTAGDAPSPATSPAGAVPAASPSSATADRRHCR